MLLSGAVLGKRFGGLSQFLYFLLGGIGLPLFTNTGALWGPTGGYVFGFILASWFIGYLLEKKWKVFYALLFGSLVIYFFGVINLSLFVGGFKNAVILGALPFIAGDLIKILAVLPVLKLLKKHSNF